MYSVIDSDVLTSTTDTGAGDAGVFVKVSDGNFDNDPVTYQTNSYLGKTDYPFVGTTEMYPEVNIKVTGAKGEDHALALLFIKLLKTMKMEKNFSITLRNKKNYKLCSQDKLFQLRLKVSLLWLLLHLMDQSPAMLQETELSFLQ
jgi:hypothetical protein